MNHRRRPARPAVRGGGAEQVGRRTAPQPADPRQRRRDQPRRAAAFDHLPGADRRRRRQRRRPSGPRRYDRHANQFDLQHRPEVHQERIELRPVENDGGFRSALGTRITLADDDTSSSTSRFRSRSTATAGRQRSSTPTATSRSSRPTPRAPTGTSDACTGPPRVAPFFADLDPSTGSGRFSSTPGPTVHDHLVQRPWLRVGADCQRAGGAPARRQREISTTRQRQGLGRRDLPRPPPTSSWSISRGAGLQQRRDRRTILAGHPTSPLRREELL